MGASLPSNSTLVDTTQAKALCHRSVRGLVMIRRITGWLGCTRKLRISWTPLRHALSVTITLLDPLMRLWNVTLSAVRMVARGTTCMLASWLGCCHCGHITADGRDPKELHRGGEERAQT